MLAQEQETALQILQTNNSIASPEQLAMALQNKDIPRYYQLEHSARLAWIGEQISALNYMAHSAKIPTQFDLVVESSLLDQAIMDDTELRCLLQVEMQEAFRRGITREYGDFYGITAGSMVGFLRGYRKSFKRMKALALMYEQQKKREEEEREKENRMYYELKLRGFVNPWGKKKKKKVTVEESEAHRRKIAEQRKQILENNE